MFSEEITANREARWRASGLKLSHTRMIPVAKCTRSSGQDVGLWGAACPSPLPPSSPASCLLQTPTRASAVVVTQSCPTLRPHGLQHARPPCTSPTPGVYSNSCQSYCHSEPTDSLLWGLSCALKDVEQHPWLLPFYLWLN